MAKMEPGKYCPLIRKDCIGIACSWYTQLRGTNPQTGEDVDDWLCAIVALPMLQINTAREVRQGAAATESFRNAVVGESASRSAAAAIEQGLLLQQPNTAPNVKLINGETQ
jgi:hypothetical protein